jgi:hypothetical protein
LIRSGPGHAAEINLFNCAEIVFGHCQRVLRRPFVLSELMKFMGGAQASGRLHDESPEQCGCIVRFDYPLGGGRGTERASVYSDDVDKHWGDVSVGEVMSKERASNLSRADR